MKTLIRGYIHQTAFYAALIASCVLISKSHSDRALVANVIYCLSLTSLYAASGLYHCYVWPAKRYALIRSIDHAAIFALIAGTTTPIYMLGLNQPLGLRLLMLTWTIALIGMFLTIFWSNAPKWLRALFYVALGWFALPYLHVISSALGAASVRLLIIGGVFYTVGALAYAAKWPNPLPRIFGYHEIFHVFVVLGSAFHFYVIYMLTIVKLLH